MAQASMAMLPDLYRYLRRMVSDPVAMRDLLSIAADLIHIARVLVDRLLS